VGSDLFPITRQNVTLETLHIVHSSQFLCRLMSWTYLPGCHLSMVSAGMLAGH